MNQDILEAFAEYQRSITLAKTTIRNRHSILSTLSKKTGLPLLELELRDLRRYLGRDDVEPGTTRTERGAMVAFYTFAQEDGYRADNPTGRLTPISAPKGTPRPFTAEQIDAMLNSGAYRKTRAMIMVGYYQGFRVSSIVRVHGRDLDIPGMTIRTIGKGGKYGTLPLHPMIAELASTMPADDWWFPARGERHGHMSSASATNLITIAKKRAGILDPKLTPHSLRHSFGTDLVEHGVDIRVVQELMMHASLSTTQIYTGVSAGRKRDGIQKLTPRTLATQSGRVTALRPPVQPELPAAA